MKARVKCKYEGKIFECELAPYGDEYLLTMEGGEKVLFESIDIEIMKKCPWCEGEGMIQTGNGYDKYHTPCGFCDGEGYVSHVKDDEKKFHVHVYEVSRKAEVDVLTVNEEMARARAIRAVKVMSKKANPFHKSDCKMISMTFPVEEEKEDKQVGESNYLKPFGTEIPMSSKDKPEGIFIDDWKWGTPIVILDGGKKGLFLGRDPSGVLYSVVVEGEKSNRLLGY